MTITLHAGPAVSMPARLTMPEEIKALVGRWSGAQILMLGTASPDEFGNGQQAARVFAELVTKHGCLSLHYVTGQAPAIAGVSSHAASSHGHERRWLAAGDLLDRLSGITVTDAPLVLIHRDPWSVHVRKQWPRQPIAQVLIADLSALMEGSEREYWRSIAEWLQSLSGIIVVEPRVLLAMGTEEGVDPVVDMFGPADGGGRVLIDESEAALPDPDLVQRVLSRWPDGEIFLLSPHIEQYRADHSGLIDRCRIALDRRDLAMSVYRHLLAAISIYVAPNGLPLGHIALKALPKEAEIFVPAEVELPAYWRGQRRDLPTVAEGPATHRTPEPIHLDSPRFSQTTGHQLSQQNIDSFTNWWTHIPTENADAIHPAAPLLTQKTVQGTADFSFLVCCHKYLQRFRIFMQSVVRQNFPLDRLEVCVASHGNPDGLREYIDLLRIAYPNLRIAVVDIPSTLARNKGKQVNQAFALSTAPVVMVADCDIVLPPDFISAMLREHHTDEVLGCWRTPMGLETTARIITGSIDPVVQFATLSKEWDKQELDGGVRQGMLGYCQVVARGPFSHIGYPEDFEVYNQSDIVFIERLHAIGVRQRFLKDRYVLHLSHPRDWTGTKVFL